MDLLTMKSSNQCPVLKLLNKGMPKSFFIAAFLRSW